MFICGETATEITKIKDIMAQYGQASFWIMFVHLPMCRVFDWFYINANYPDKFEELYYVIDTVIFPEKFWVLYLFIGLGISMLIYQIFQRSVTFLKRI